MEENPDGKMLRGGGQGKLGSIMKKAARDKERVVKAGIQAIRHPRNLTRLYRMVMELIHLTFIIPLVADNLLPKTPRPNTPFALLQTSGC